MRTRKSPTLAAVVYRGLVTDGNFVVWARGDFFWGRMRFFRRILVVFVVVGMNAGAARSLAPVAARHWI
ncbi:MAG: hypothetical protein QM760_07405 [Nibricoccus sp.]